jgi:hypothetical protein
MVKVKIYLSLMVKVKVLTSIKNNKSLEIEVDLSALIAGLYYVTVQSSDGQIDTHRIVKL